MDTTDPFDKVSLIFERCQDPYFEGFNAIDTFLNGEKIRHRTDDSRMLEYTISRPTSVDSHFVIGRRYEKTGGTLTEDHFLIKRGEGDGARGVIKHYSGCDLESTLTEYRGTHKGPCNVQGPQCPTTNTLINSYGFLNPHK